MRRAAGRTKASVVSGLAVRPAPARPRIGIVRRVLRARLVLQIVELVQLPEQRLQAQLGGGIPVRLIREALRNAGRAFVVALRPHRPSVTVGFSSLCHDTPFPAGPDGLFLVSVAFTWGLGSIDAAAAAPVRARRRARARRGPPG